MSESGTLQNIFSNITKYPIFTHLWNVRFIEDMNKFPLNIYGYY